MKATYCLIGGVFLGLLCVLVKKSEAKDWPTPPPWQEKAKMARYLAHYADWGVVAAVSPEFDFVPLGTIQSFADGPLDDSTGIPYFYVSNMSDTYKAVSFNSSASLALSMAESSRCEAQKLDPESPLCARLTLVGKFIKVTDAKEVNFANKSLVARHPEMADWPKDHGWQYYKLDITTMNLLDIFGGGYRVPLKDYYSATP